MVQQAPVRAKVSASVSELRRVAQSGAEFLGPVRPVRLHVSSTASAALACCGFPLQTSILRLDAPVRSR